MLLKPIDRINLRLLLLKLKLFNQSDVKRINRMYSFVYLNKQKVTSNMVSIQLKQSLGYQNGKNVKTTDYQRLTPHTLQSGVNADLGPS